MPDPQRARRELLQLALAALGADAALITSPANVRYLTGLASSNAALLLPAAPASGPRPGHRLPLRGHGRGDLPRPGAS